MVRTKTHKRIRSPIVGPREKELLDRLEAIKSSRIRVTTLEFCKHVGYANKSALRHFPVLKRELSLYIAQFAGRRENPPSITRYFEVQMERQNQVIDRLKTKVSTIPKLKAKIFKLEAKEKVHAEAKKRLRGMLSSVVALLSGSDFAKARDLHNRLEKEVNVILDEE